CSPDDRTILANIGGLTPISLQLGDPDKRDAFEGHTARVQDTAFSADGTYNATAGADQTVRVWETASGRLIANYRGLGRPATSVCWLPGGSYILAGDDLGSTRVFAFPRRTLPDSLSGLYG